MYLKTEINLHDAYRRIQLNLCRHYYIVFDTLITQICDEKSDNTLISYDTAFLTFHLFFYKTIHD